MKPRNYGYAVALGLMLAVLIPGCSWLKGYGKIRVQSGPEKVGVEELALNWHQYTIYYTGHYGKLSIKHPSAVMFDPKADQKSLVGEKWTQVRDRETLLELIDSIQSQKAVYYPRVWKILGPDDHLYGYLFTALDQVAVKVLDDKTMYVYNLPEPPYLKSYPGGGVSCPGSGAGCGS